MRSRNFLTPVVASLVLALIVEFTSAFGVSARADSAVTYHGRLVIDHATATPGETGENSVLRLRITNDGDDTVHLLGLKTLVSTNARLVARISISDTVIMESFGIPADGVLDLRSSHMWLELGPLVRPLIVGESIPVEMIFVSGPVRIDVRVRGAEG